MTDLATAPRPDAAEPAYEAAAPGPWDWLAIGANATGGHHLYITDANGRKIAAVWGRHPEKEATARLFAAAPDLLEQTKLLERSLVYEIRKSEHEGDDEGARLKSFTLAMVRAVIAKATGATS